MKTKKILAFLFVLSLALGLANLNLVQAQSSGYVFPTTNLPDAPGGIRAILANLLNWILGIIGIIAVIAFVIAGLQYLISAGDEEKMKSAKRAMVYSIIGTIVALSGLVVVKAIDAALWARTNF
jgi:heme/copper-type cytochrome/quinol oxidase subunit 2